MDSDNPGEVVAPLSWPLNDQLEDLIRRLELATSGETRSGQAESMSQLIDEGALLWRGVLPEKVRHQFWERRDKIKHLSIWSENDRVPWELMYTADAGRETGFLVEQFSLTRDIFDRPGLARRLRSLPARFVLPPDSPPAASREIQFLRELLGVPGQKPRLSCQSSCHFAGQSVKANSAFCTSPATTSATRPDQ